MEYFYHSRAKTKRLGVVIGALLCYFLLLLIDAVRTFSHGINTVSLLLWMCFGSSVLIALLFLAVGSLVWYYARNRFIASLLFCFSFAMMTTFIVETGATANDPLLSALGSGSGQFALFLLAVLLLSFPRNYLTLFVPGKTAVPDGSSRVHGHGERSALILRFYIALLFFVSIFSTGTSAIFAIPSTSIWPVSNWINTFDYFYDVVVLVSIVVTMVISYRQSFLPRERQQIRLLVIGVIIALAPPLVLTILPLALNWPAKFIIDPRITTLSLILLPLAFGYAILRYQILAFDTYIRRATTILAGIVSLAILTYLVITLSSFLFTDGIAYVICVSIVMALLAPLVWHITRSLVDRLFFSEQMHYNRLIERFDRPSSEAIDLNEAAQLITQAVINVLETPEACLFVLDEETGHYHLYPPLSYDAGKLREGDRSRQDLAQTLVGAINPQLPVYGDVLVEQDWLGGNTPAIEQLIHTRRPLLLSEAVRAVDALPTRFARYMGSTMPLGSEPLLAPVHAQGKLIGILALDQRGEGLQYSGPDFEAIDVVLTRFAPILETARLYTQTSRHVALLDTLYSASSILREAFSSIEDAARVYAEIAAGAIQGTARVWFYDEQQQALKDSICIGPGPIIKEQVISSTDDDDWNAFFSEGDDIYTSYAITRSMPPCLASIAEVPRRPYAWLPLKRGQQRLGVLVIVYIQPHIFSQQERRVLEMFASQCAAALESTRINLELRVAYERQKELDRLKDQFIMTASHELRTPLTAVMGYLELLGEYAPTLAPERMSDFIAKAYRGCDELTLLVSNIIDASHVQLDVEKIQHTTVSLANSVQHVLEILEAMTRREQRSILVDIPRDLTVEADEFRLRQVLLNLVNNALKYSPAGTGVEITAHLDKAGKMVTIAITDHGLGVPVEEQHRLFERFTRLERDMNSPVRGAGLGLYICKQLVEAMGGHIRVESTGIAGEGSTFAFTLRRSELQKRVDHDSPAASLSL